ncbi:MAG: type II toxin-antitoxin system VapC family toxin [Polaribacter sp.]
MDLLLKRKDFFKAAEDLFSLADKGNITLAVSALTIANTYYLVSKTKSNTETREILRKFKVLVSVVSLTDKIIELSLNDTQFSNFEDGIQYYAALDYNCNSIITRNLKDFKNSKIPVITAHSFIASLY